MAVYDSKKIFFLICTVNQSAALLYQQISTTKRTPQTASLIKPSNHEKNSRFSVRSICPFYNVL